MKYYIKVEKDVKILVEDINFDLGKSYNVCSWMAIKSQYV